MKILKISASLFLGLLCVLPLIADDNTDNNTAYRGGDRGGADVRRGPEDNQRQDMYDRYQNPNVREQQYRNDYNRYDQNWQNGVPIQTTPYYYNNQNPNYNSNYNSNYRYNPFPDDAQYNYDYNRNNHPYPQQ